MDHRSIEEIIIKLGMPRYRTGQILEAVYQRAVSSYMEISTLPIEIRQQLDKEAGILSFEPVSVLCSGDRRSAKALLRLKDGHMIETVLIAPKPGDWSACISSQVGCPLGCGFCATGFGGFKRNLTAEEITDQVLWWKQWLKKQRNKGQLTDIVYMGMGEPFLNWQNVSASLRTLTDKNLFGFGSRSISVSTAGIPDGIDRLAKEFPQVNLAISLHFATDEKRSRYMPVNKKFPLSVIAHSLQNYCDATNRKVFLEYILLHQVNDSDADAEYLIRLIKTVGHPKLLHVNLIRYNQTSLDCIPSSRQSTIRFRDYLQKKGVHVTIRKSLGQDIQGACGQLAGNTSGGMQGKNAVK